MRGIIVRGLARIAATHGHHFIVTGLTSLTKDICREAFENAEPLAPHETEELFTISHEQVGLLSTARTLPASPRKGQWFPTSS